MKKTIFKISLALITVLFVCLLTFFLSQAAIGMVSETGNKYVILEVANRKMYRFAERILTGSDNEYPTIKLYTKNAGRYSAGQYIISFTSGGQESSMPPGIRSYFDFSIG